MTEEEIKSEIKKLKCNRGTIKSQVTRFSNFLQSFEIANKTCTELEKRLQKIEPLWEEFMSIQGQIEVLDESAAQIADLERELNGFEGIYFDLISRAQDIINENLNRVAQVHAQSSVTSLAQAQNIAHQPTISVKLPALDLPKFSGSYNEYLQFFDTFKSLIEQNQSLSKVQKFYYLKSCLVGEAQKITQSLEVTEQNYDIALDLLKKRYENKRIIINSHLKSIFDLPSLTKENSHSLRTLLDTFLKDFRSLKNLGEPVENWSSILIYVLLSKLDFSSKREWENSIKDKHNIVLPTIDEFIDFLSSRCQLLETIYISKASSSSGGFESNKGMKNNYSINNFSGQSQSKTKCYFCKENHCLYYCQKFINLSPQARVKEVQKINLCNNCLRKAHTGVECKGQCKKCGSKAHNTLLHIDSSKEQSQIKFNKNESLVNSVVQDQNTSLECKQGINFVPNTLEPSLKLSMESSSFSEKGATSISSHCSEVIHTSVLLGTAEMLIKTDTGDFIKCRALLDGGSQSNFMTKSLFKKLHIQADHVSFPIIGIGGSQTAINQSIQTEVKSLYSDFSQILSFLILDKITNNVPQTFQVATVNDLKIPANILLADSNFMISREIDILLGAAVFYSLLLNDQIKLGINKPILTKTRVGWILAGPLPGFSNKVNQESCLVSTNSTNIDIQRCMERLWEIESLPECTKPILTKEESFCETHFLNNVKRDSTGRFEVSLPMRDNVIQFINQGQDNFDIAKKRFLGMEQKMSRDPDFERLYKCFMHEYELLNHMTRLKQNEINSTKHVINYLPHHAVLKESSKTTKLRVVFDASAKSHKSNLSLNETLCVGPVIQDDLYSILLRFRKHNFVMKADITKMYRQININPDQKHLQRILWRENPNKDISHYTLNTVTYGTSSASFLAIRSLQQAAIESRDKYPQASQIILSDFVVDDLISGAETYDDLQLLRAQISEILNKAGFELTQWMFNHQNDADQDGFYISNTSNETVKTLGVLWNPNQDVFQYVSKIKINSQFLTKRVVLSIISQIFDPLGLIGPILVRAKIILQELWKMSLDWDDPIPGSHSEHFLNFFYDLQAINGISAPRHVLLSTYVTLQIHGFADASMAAYGGCVYLRTTDSHNQTYVQLLTAKSRVAPIKAVSLPRLELCGAVLVSKLINKSINAMKIMVDPTQIHLWTDSEIVLAWLSQEPSTWKVFIANRVSEVQTSTNIKCWRHVASADNPADVISRGCKPSDLTNCELWWSGPHWLKDHEASWPIAQNKFILNVPEKRDLKGFSISCHSENGDFNLLTKFSSFRTLIHVTAFCLRFSKNARLPKLERSLTTFLSTLEIDNAANVLIKIIQTQSFHEEIFDLRRKGRVSKNSKLLSLNPFLKDDILRVGGRLKHSNLSPDHKNPILLPNNHFFTILVIRHEHHKTLHGGVQMVLSSVRNKFWIINGKNTVRRVLHQCLTCFRIKPIATMPLMGQLPSARVNPSMPFSSTGIDFAGPILVKDGTLRCRKLVKTYVCVFVCLCTKAIHLELVGDLTTNCFLNALKRFIARRGFCNNIYSDNGTNFVGANNYLNEIYEKLALLQKDQLIRNFLLESRVTWHFIPPRSPNFGGLWESAVKSMKYHLIRTVGEHRLTYENLYTVLTQIEAVLNSRPLCPLSSDPNDLNALTPGHFLVGRELISTPDRDFTDLPTTKLSKYQEIQKMIQSFWKRWSNEYLHNLQQRNKWKVDNAQHIKPGLLVLIRDDGAPPMYWKLGRICELFPGDDQVIRVVSVKTQSGTLRRAVNKLCVLPIMY